MGTVKRAPAKKSAPAKASTSSRPITSAVSSVASSVLGLSGKGRATGGKRRHRQTPQKLAKQIMIFKLKKKLARLRGY